MNEDLIAIFPLPNVIFFPKTLLPLHIFEPRYRQMVQDTIATKQLIGMFLLEDGWQENYYGNPNIHSIGCAGEMIHVETLPDGKFDIVLRGLYRVRPIEIVQEFPYRKARVEVLPEILTEGPAKVQRMTENLISEFKKVDPEGLRLLESDEPDLAEVVNHVANQLPMELETRLELLKIDDVYLRAESVYELLSKRISALDWTRRFERLRPEDPNQN
jgi:Lon protease-like protein